MAIKAKCEKCGDDFLIITKEVEFYKDKDLPLPKNCPNCRLERRINLRDKKVLLGYTCDNCEKDIITAVEPKEGRQIFCKECFQKYMENNDCILGYSEGYKATSREAAPEPDAKTTQNANMGAQVGDGEEKDPVSW